MHEEDPTFAKVESPPRLECKGIWGGIRNRWISLLHRAATGTKKTWTLLTPIGVVIFGVFTALFVVLAVLIDRLLTLPWPVPDVISWLVSVPLMAIGLAATAGGAGWHADHRHQTDPAEISRRVARNPIDGCNAVQLAATDPPTCVAGLAGQVISAVRWFFGGIPN